MILVALVEDFPVGEAYHLDAEEGGTQRRRGGDLAVNAFLQSGRPAACGGEQEDNEKCK